MPPRCEVLGATIATTETDFNNIPTGKWFFYNLTGKTNYPSQATSGGVLLSTLTTQGMSYQYYHETSTNAIYYRSRWYNNDWYSWQRIDNYGTTSLSDLASALGGKIPNGYITSSVDLNDYLTTGVWKINNVLCTNIPTNSRYFLFEVTRYIGTDTVEQKVVDLSDLAEYLRVKEGNNWSVWKRTENFGCNTASELASLLGVYTGTLPGSGTVDAIDNAKAYWDTMPSAQEKSSFASGFINGNYSAFVMIWRHAFYGRIELRYRGTGELETYIKTANDNTWTKL